MRCNTHATQYLAAPNGRNSPSSVGAGAACSAHTRVAGLEQIGTGCGVRVHTQQYSNEPQHWQTSRESGRHGCSIAARSVRTIGFLSTRRPPTSAFHFTPRTRQTTVAFTGKKKQLITRGNKAPVSGAAHASPHIFLCELGRTHAPTPFMGFYNHRPKQCQRSR